jgi:hypothetical protein
MLARPLYETLAQALLQAAGGGDPTPRPPDAPADVTVAKG